MKDYTLNEDYFEVIDTEEKAYWLGMIAADGHIRGNFFHLGFSIKDEEHLESFRSAIELSRPLLKAKKVLDGKVFESRRVRFSNKRLVCDLNRHGIPLGAKTFILEPPKRLSDDLIRHWIRGYFDGDGSFGLNTKRSNFMLGLTSTLPICTFIRDYFNITCGLKMGNIYHKKKHHELIYRFQVRGNIQIYKIATEMYKDSTVYLLRKYNYYLKLLELRGNYSDESNRRYNRVN